MTQGSIGHSVLEICAAELSSLHGVRIDLLLRAVMIRNIAFRVSLSSLFSSGSPALRWNLE